MTEHDEPTDPTGRAADRANDHALDHAIDRSVDVIESGSEALGIADDPTTWSATARALWAGSAWRVLWVLVLSGVLFDLLVRCGAATVAGSATSLAFVVGTGWAAPIRGAAGRVALGSAVIFALCLSVRSSAWIVPLDLAAVVLLVLLGVALDRSSSVRQVGFFAIGRSWVVGLGTACGAPIHLATFTAAHAPAHTEVARRRGGTVARGLLFAAPVVVTVTVLLASADGVFRSFIEVPVDGAALAQHVALAFAGACIAIVPLVRARATTPPPPQMNRRVAMSEVAMVLGALVGVYALFAVSQATALARGDAYIQRATGLTYAEYARRGYFQLLVVASISAVVLLAVRANAAPSGGTADRIVRRLAASAALLTLVIIASALRRLELYGSALGSTMLRLACSVFAVWMAVVFLLLAAGFVRGRRAAHDQLPIVLLVTAFATLFVWNTMNPEAYVARHNLGRSANGTALDIAYLTSLSDDATPGIVAALDRVTPAQRAEVLGRLCSSDAPDARGWLATSVAHERARDALEPLCHP